MDDTSHHVVAHIFDLVSSCVDVLHVVAERDCAEDEAEENTHQTHQKQLSAVDDDTVENGAEGGNLSQDVDEMQEKHGWEVESAHYR